MTVAEKSTIRRAAGQQASQVPTCIVYTSAESTSSVDTQFQSIKEKVTDMKKDSVVIELDDKKCGNTKKMIAQIQLKLRQYFGLSISGWDNDYAGHNAGQERAESGDEMNKGFDEDEDDSDVEESEESEEDDTEDRQAIAQFKKKRDTYWKKHFKGEPSRTSSQFVSSIQEPSFAMHSPVILNNSMETDKAWSNLDHKDSEGLVDSFKKQVTLQNQDNDGDKEMEPEVVQEEKKKQKKEPAPRHMSSRY
jgi:hypothetical protein